MDRDTRKRIQKTMHRGADAMALPAPVTSSATRHDYLAEAAEVNARRLRDEIAELRALTARLAVTHENVARLTAAVAADADRAAYPATASVIADALADDPGSAQLEAAQRARDGHGVRHVAG